MSHEPGPHRHSHRHSHGAPAGPEGKPAEHAEAARLTYEQAGVDVAAGNEAVRLLKERITTARHPFVLSGIGGFGGAIRMPPIKDGVLVAGCDGVGTKTMLARQAGVYDTIGIDLVAMSANDVSACGAVPYFFLDYLVVGKLEPERVAEIVGGVDEGCRRAECVLLGGETAEHPDHFAADDLDLAGFCVGLAERHELWSPDKVQEGDAIVGLDSSGLHSNGYSLVRALLAQHGIALDTPFAATLGGDQTAAIGDDQTPATGGDQAATNGAPVDGAGDGVGAPTVADRTVADVLLEPTVVYSVALHDLGHACDVHAAAHITGGGFPDNVGRALPAGLAARLDLTAWQPPPVFSWLHSLGVDHDELLRTFNCGIGAAVVLPENEVAKAIDVLARGGHPARVIGEVVDGASGASPISYHGHLQLMGAGDR